MPTRFPITKLAPSFVPRHYLSRERLLSHLAQPTNVALMLVVAPAGSGKTTLLHDHVRTHPVAWVSLGEEDCDLQLFLLCLTEALGRQYPGCIEATRSTLLRPGARVTRGNRLQSLLINELLVYGAPVTLVLDDFHVVERSDQVTPWVQSLLHRAPSNFRLILASRTMPRLALSRLRAQGSVLTLDRHALQFSVPEAVQLFHQVFDQPVAPDWIAALVHKMAGWVTGLCLASQSLRRLSASADVGHAIPDFDEHIYDYLCNEVLEAQPPELQDFLLRTAVPSSFSRGLADSLCASVPSHTAVAHLERSQLFLSRSHDGSYSYQDLFRKFLLHRAELSLDSSLEELHGRAARWFEQARQPGPAIDHYLSAGEDTRVVDLLSAFGGQFVQEGQYAAVSRWLQRLPFAVRECHPGLLTLQAELAELAGQTDKAHRLFRLALLVEADPGRRARTLECLCLSLMRQAESQSLIDVCRQGLETVPPPAPSLRALLLSWMGAAYVYTGVDWTQGYALLEEGYTLSHSCREPRARAWSALTFGFAYHFARGDRRQTVATLTEGVVHCQAEGLPQIGYQLSLSLALIHVMHSDVASARAALADIRTESAFITRGVENCLAMAYFEEGSHQRALAILCALSPHDLPNQFLPLYHRTLLLCHLRAGALDEASRHVDQMRQALRACPAGLYSLECGLAEARWLLAGGQSEAARRLLEENLARCVAVEARHWESKTRSLLESLKSASVAEPLLELRAFGSLEIHFGGQPIDVYAEARPMVIRLLKLFLCATERTLSVDQILETLWRQADPSRGKNNLSVHLAALRTLLRVPRALPRIGDAYRLNLGRVIVYDVQAFEREVRTGRHLLSQREPAQAEAHFANAERIGFVPFLRDDLYDDAIVARRAALESEQIFVTEQLAQACLERGDTEPAAGRYRRLLAAGQLTESSFLKLCRCRSLVGDRLAARRDLELFRGQLLEVGGLEPRRETVKLVHRL